MNHPKPHYRKGMFNHETLIVQFGGPLSKPEHVFTAMAIKVPDYKYKVKEKADAGGGCYYGYSEINEYTQSNAYLIVKDGSCIGYMIPYHFGIKSDLLPVDKAPEQIKKFIAKQGIPTITL